MSGTGLTGSKRTKSRAKLYNIIQGVNRLGTGGASAVGSIQFANIPTAGETVTIGGYWFKAQAAASEAAGTSAGTEADPHLFQSITDLATAGASLAAQILAETATTGAAGYLFPVDATGVDFTTDTLTLTFYPGAWANSITLAGSAGDETIVQPVTASLGVNTSPVRLDYATTLIDNTGSAGIDHYTLEDGDYIGQRVVVACDTYDTNDISVLGNFVSSGAKVQMLLNATSDSVSLTWGADGWVPTDIVAGATYTAA